MRIGIFDSGIGGLTAVRELERLDPDAGYTYFGDTARVPYGTRSVDVINRYAEQDCRFLLSKGAEAILVACCTVSTTSLPLLKSAFGVPIYAVVEPTVRSAAKIAAAGNGIVAVLGTNATIKSGAFEKELHFIDGSLKVVSVACPLFVPLVENGRIGDDDPISLTAAGEYLESIIPLKPSAVILGCTHYPLLTGVIKKYLPESRLINCAAETVAEVIEGCRPDRGEKKLYVSDDPASFCATAKLFLGRRIDDNVEKADIEKS